jgi:hypothetical protein
MKGTIPDKKRGLFVWALQKGAWGVEYGHYGSNMVKKPLICPIRPVTIVISRSIGLLQRSFFLGQRN